MTVNSTISNMTYACDAQQDRAVVSDSSSAQILHNANGMRVNTALMVYEKLMENYPGKHITVASTNTCNLQAFQATGKIKLSPSADNSGPGALAEQVLIGKFDVEWEGSSAPFVVYIVEGRDGQASYPMLQNNFIISDTADTAQRLLLAAGQYGNELHEEVLVYNNGLWQKDAVLWKAIQKASWDAVILDPDMKKGIRNDINRFFDSQATYKKLGVPWKRGIILHGPPGNGKTISLKAAMNELYKRDFEVPTLYVKSLASFGGPEYSLNQIFSKARATAPCLLVFEDLDTLISPDVRSFFLNEVDGLSENDGLLMVGSTNHLERLDPGISKRPSRFDRKYLFPNPNFDERVLYAEFWRKKLHKSSSTSPGAEDLPSIKFPQTLCKPIAEITDRFSFAYMQEAFVATLLQIATGNDDDDGVDVAWDRTLATDRDELNHLVLWREFQKQVKILREQIGNGKDN